VSAGRDDRTYDFSAMVREGRAEEAVRPEVDKLLDGYTWLLAQNDPDDEPGVES